ncbi:hypothetical protein ACJ73_03946 [Blastomyces percursus]|uniref:Uncharacterized protein n=1 Tax=Blastomyces percursus TaxID=1658174 RepID=A0A1J9RAK0_9EURO|nr:hypothetical protein ACJ73_03946 [Blastomyces percursus]
MAVNHHLSLNCPDLDDPQNQYDLVEWGTQEPVVPSRHACSMDLSRHLRGTQPNENENCGSEFLTYAPHGSNPLFPSGLGEVRSTQPRLLEERREGPLNPSPVAPDFRSGATSGTIPPADSRTAEFWDQWSDDFHAMLSTYTSADNGDTIKPGASEFVGGFVALNGGIRDLGVSYSHRNQSAGFPTEPGYLPDISNLVPSPQHNGISPARDGYDLLEPYGATNDALVIYDSQVDSGLVEQQDTQIPNNGKQGLDEFRVSCGPVDGRTNQQTANPNECTGDIQGSSKQKSCWQCRFKHEQCAGGTPCRKCEGIKGRKGPYRYRVPCFRNGLEEFRGTLFPEILRGPILLRSWYLEHICHFRNDPFPGIFTLLISVGFGEPIQTCGRRIDTQREVLIRTRTIKTDNRSSTVVSEEVLPIRPGGELNDFVYNIGSWVDNMVERLDLGSWISATRNSHIHSRASCKVLRAVFCYFINCGADFAPSPSLRLSTEGRESGVDPYATLGHALKAAILATVLSTCLKISPECFDSLQEIFQMDPNELSRMQTIPHLVNKVFKLAVYELKKLHVRRALLGLDKLLRQKSILEGHVGCIVTLLATAMSSTQLSLVDVCLTTRGTDGAVVFEQVKHEIFELESLVSKLRCLFHRRCKIENIKEERRYRGLDEKTQQLVDSLSKTIPALKENTSNMNDLEFESMEHIQDLAHGNSVPAHIAQFNADRLFYGLWGPMLPDNPLKRKNRN